MKTLEQITLSEAMRRLGMHPQDKKRSELNKHLTKLPAKKFGSSHAVYSAIEVEALKEVTV